MDVREVVLRGVGVTLFPLSEEHEDALYDIGVDARIWAYMPVTVTTRQDIHRFIETALEAKQQGTELPFAIYDHASKRVVGSTRYLDISTVNRGLEIGWTWLSPTVWRTRVNTEAKYLLFKHAFEDLNCLRVQLKTDARNVRSQEAISRIGATREGVLRNHRILPDGFIRDTVMFSVLDREWPMVKERLIGFLSSPEVQGEHLAQTDTIQF